MTTGGEHLDAFKRVRMLPEKSRWARNLLCLAIVGAVSFVAGRTQVPQYNGGLPGREHTSSGFPGLPENANPHPDGVRALRDSMQSADNQKRLKELNLQRQKQMTDDTAKLLALANELKLETEKSTKETISMTEVRKAELIEKLARSVREKMKASAPTPAE